eukprot:1159706-Pelagomonas_calceolata.AAC.4
MGARDALAFMRMGIELVCGSGGVANDPRVLQGLCSVQSWPHVMPLLFCSCEAAASPAASMPAGAQMEVCSADCLLETAILQLKPSRQNRSGGRPA